MLSAATRGRYEATRVHHDIWRCRFTFANAWRAELGRVLINCDHVRVAPIATPDVQPQQMTRWAINGLFGLRSGSSKANGK